MCLHFLSGLEGGVRPNFSTELWLAEWRRSRARWHFSNVMSRLHKHALKPSHTDWKTYLHLYIDMNDNKRKENACQSWQDRTQKVYVNKNPKTAWLSRRRYSHVRTLASGEINLFQFLYNSRQQIGDIFRWPTNTIFGYTLLMTLWFTDRFGTSQGNKLLFIKGSSTFRKFSFVRN